MLPSLTCATTFGGPHQFRQHVVFADQCAAERRPFADADEASEALRWSSGPAGKRAAQALDTAMADAYRARQVEQAREAVAVHMADDFDPADHDIYAEESLIDSAVLAAARATHVSDGELSTLIRPADIVDLIAAHFPITDRENAEWLAERALIDIHVPFREPTPEEAQAVREEVAFVEAWCAAPEVLATIHPTADLAEALQERFPDLAPHDAAKAAEHALRITVEPADNAAENAAPARLDLADPANWNDPAKMPDKLKSSLISATPYQWIDPAEIPTRPWVFGHWLLRGTVTALIAPGGVGKSTFTSAMALSLTTGRALLNKNVHGGQQRTWLWNLEDARDEMQRSIQATAKHFGIRGEDIAGRLFVDTAMDGSGLCTATEDGSGFKLLAPVYDAITAEIRKRQIDVLVVDPFVSSHEVEENANSKIDKIAKAWARVANDANCSVVLVHHTSKAGAGEVTAMSARGAKALTDACRSALVLNRMDDQTASSFGFDDAERRRYFTVSDDKHNRAPAAGADWFRLSSIDLGNGSGNLRPGDSVGVAVPWTPPSPMEGVGEDELLCVQRAIADGEWRESDQSEQWAGHAVAGALDIDVGTAAGKRRVKSMLSTWVREGALQIVERKDSNYKPRKFVEVGNPTTSATPPPHGGG